MKRSILYFSILFLFLTSLYVLYVFSFVKNRYSKKSTQNNSQIYLVETEWKNFISKGKNKKSSFFLKGIESFSDPLLKYVVNNVIEKENLKDEDLFLIKTYMFFFPYFEINGDEVPKAVVNWNKIPNFIKENEEKIANSETKNFVSACVALSLLESPNRPSPKPLLLKWMREQATHILRNGYPREGLFFLKKLETYLTEKDPEFDAWLGAAFVMQAIDAKTGLEKINFVEKGMQKIEKAILKWPQNITCLYIRVNTYLSLPSFYKDQWEKGVSDLVLIVDALENNKYFTFTNNYLEQEETKVDPCYLLEVLIWVKNNKELEKKYKTVLEQLISRVELYTNKEDRKR
ncbi:MAG: hypothetical protein N2Z76_05535 [Treponemataceae bacterium]|nr:hypothetical protein [Treponemataceae bacterium]